MNAIDLESFRYFLSRKRDEIPGIAARIFGSTSSTTRLEVLLDEVNQLPNSLGYELFRDVWPSCDDTFFLRRQTLEFLWEARDELDPLDFLSTDETVWISSLPERFRVYRGCDATRVSGVSWTTDRNVAIGFAYGHRGILNPEPVLVSGMIRKHAVLAAMDDRSEREIVAEFSLVREKRIVSLDRSPAW